MKTSIQFRNISLAAMLVGISGCALTGQPETEVQVQKEQVCVNTRGEVVDCPDNVGEYASHNGNPASAQFNGQHVAQQNKQISGGNKSANRLVLNKRNRSGMPQLEEQNYVTPHSLYGASHSVVLDEYIEQIASELIHNVSDKTKHAVVGITSFVDFNNDLSSITPFGNLVSEHFTTQLSQNGFQVADYKVKNTISVTANGDFVFSRDASKLSGSENMTHVLTGTILYQKSGLMINARIVDFNNKWVVSTAKGFIPYFVLDTIVPAAGKQAVM